MVTYLSKKHLYDLQYEHGVLYQQNSGVLTYAQHRDGII